MVTLLPTSFSFYSFSLFGAQANKRLSSQAYCREVPCRCPGCMHVEESTSVLLSLLDIPLSCPPAVVGLLMQLHDLIFTT